MNNDNNQEAGLKGWLAWCHLTVQSKTIITILQYRVFLLLCQVPNSSS